MIHFIIPFSAAIEQVAKEDCHLRTEDFVHELPIAFHVQIRVKLACLEQNPIAIVSIFVDKLGVGNQC